MGFEAIWVCLLRPELIVITETSPANLLFATFSSETINSTSTTLIPSKSKAHYGGKKSRDATATPGASLLASRMCQVSHLDNDFVTDDVKSAAQHLGCTVLETCQAFAIAHSTVSALRAHAGGGGLGSITHDSTLLHSYTP
jgi:hypothetical protein